MPDSTEQLTTAMAAGDEKAVELFYRQYFDWLYAHARRASRRDEAFCLDVVQDAVLRIIRLVRPVKSEAQFRAWLRLVVRTTAWDRLRNEQRRTQREALVVMGPQRATDESFDESQVDWLRQELARFDPQIVRLIEMRFEQRWTLARIAKIIGMSIGTVDGRLRRAIGELKLRAMDKFDE